MKRLRIQMILAATIIGSAISLFTACAETDNAGSPTTELLAEDNGNGITITITPFNGASAPGNVSSAQVARFKSRIANIQAKAGHRAADDQQPVAEMVIFARDGYYHCAPFQYSTTYSSYKDESGKRQNGKWTG